MSRDKPDIFGQRLKTDFDILDESTHVTAPAQIDVRNAPGEKLIAHMDDVGSREMHDAVAIGMPRRHMPYLDFLSVEVNRQRIVERHNRQPAGNFDAASACGHRAQALPDIRVGNNRALLAEEGITARMIAMMVRVDDELQFARRNLLHCRLDLLRQRRILIIHHKQPIRPC
jgi:hypothetical protein